MTHSNCKRLSKTRDLKVSTNLGAAYAKHEVNPSVGVAVVSVNVQREVALKALYLQHIPGPLWIQEFLKGIFACAATNYRVLAALERAAVCQIQFIEAYGFEKSSGARPDLKAFSGSALSADWQTGPQHLCATLCEEAFEVYSYAGPAL